RYHALTREPGDNPYMYRDMPTLFLGERTDASGDTRYIEVQYLRRDFVPNDDGPPQFRISNSPPGGFIKDFGGGFSVFDLRHRDGPLDATRPMRLFAGQRDPQDPSGIIIDFEVGGAHDTFTIILDFKRHQTN